MTQKSLSHDFALAQAYAVCRSIAKREAKNFYYAFVALPFEKRNAICAIYAFMRQADDLADDESLSIAERQKQLDAWLSEWESVSQSGAASNPVFIAVRDTTQRFGIPRALLDELVAGVTMDLERGARGFTDTYKTFDDLYSYCYLVASVVGLVCIRIFGYSDPHAERLAEETGVAFQLTNILRDVAEDAARNRVYLPIEDLDAHEVSIDSVVHRRPDAPPTAKERALLEAIARRAEHYYASARQLLPLIDRESRPALWVLVSIYHALLKRIVRANYDVFTRRVSVSIFTKVGILATGIVRMLLARVFEK